MQTVSAMPTGHAFVRHFVFAASITSCGAFATACSSSARDGEDSTKSTDALALDETAVSAMLAAPIASLQPNASKVTSWRVFVVYNRDDSVTYTVAVGYDRGDRPAIEAVAKRAPTKGTFDLALRAADRSVALSLTSQQWAAIHGDLRVVTQELAKLEATANAAPLAPKSRDDARCGAHVAVTGLTAFVSFGATVTLPFLCIAGEVVTLGEATGLCVVDALAMPAFAAMTSTAPRRARTSCFEPSKTP